MGRPAGHRLFFALKPPGDVAEAIRAVRERIQSQTGRAVPVERMHATLAFLGAQSAETLDRLGAIAEALEFPACTLSLDRIGHFPRARVVWLGPSHVPTELEAFRTNLGTSLARAGVRFEGRPWRPHVTLYRDLRKRPEIIRFEPVEWPLREFQLMESIHGNAGLEYHCRGRWPA